MSIKNATVIGSGSWGSALALLLARRGLSPLLWGRDTAEIEVINRTHENPNYLPGITLPDAITATTDLGEAVSRAGDGLILFVVPSRAVRPVAEQLAEAGVVNNKALLVSCAKGIELDTGKRMTEILSEFFPDNPVAVLSGPTHAEETARELPSAAVIGCPDHAVAERLQDVFTVPWFRTYTSEDVAGIEFGGAIKNVFAIASGIAAGLGLGDNARAALVTRGLAEMTRVGTTLGGRAETFQGLSGIGDLIVTCFSEHSRNLRAGRMLGEGKTMEQLRASMTMVAEGVPNTESVYGAAHRAGLRTPIIDQVYAVLYEKKPAGEALAELLSRGPRPEAD